MKMRLTILSAAVLLAACQGGSLTVREVTGKNKFTRLEGASIVLNQELRVRAGNARVFVQDGQVGGGFNSYRPHCAFEIDSVQHDGFPIQADTFLISRVQGSIQQVVSTEPTRLAALHLARGGMDGGSSSLYEGYHFWLSSENQPDVRRMSCFGVYAQPYELYPPTLEEIRQALGPIAEVRQ